MKPLFYVFLFLFLAADSEASGIALSPHTIDIVATEGSSHKKQIMLYNLNDKHSYFSIRVSHPYFEISPQEGMVKADETLPVTLTLKPGLEPGQYRVNLIAEIIDMHSGVSLRIGTKSTINVIIEPAVIYDSSKYKGPFLTLAIVAIGVLIFKAFR